MILMTSGGPIGVLPYCCVDNLQSSDFLSEVWANSKGSLPQGQHAADQIQLIKAVGGWGWGVSLCVRHRENFEHLLKYI
jgi:hypothetical protein